MKNHPYHHDYGLGHLCILVANAIQNVSVKLVTFSYPKTSLVSSYSGLAFIPCWKYKKYLFYVPAYLSDVSYSCKSINCLLLFLYSGKKEICLKLLEISSILHEVIPPSERCSANAVKYEPVKCTCVNTDNKMIHYI